MLQKSDITLNQFCILFFSTLYGLSFLHFSKFFFLLKANMTTSILAVLFLALVIFIAIFLTLRIVTTSKMGFLSCLLALSKKYSFFVFSFLVLLWSIVLIFFVRITAENVILLLLPKTSLFLIIFTLLFLGFLVSIVKVEALFKLNQLLFYFVPIFIFLLIFGIIKDGELINILPFRGFELYKLFSVFKNLSFLFFGVGLIFFYSDFVSKKERLVRKSCYSLLFITLFYILYYFAIMSVFGEFEVDKITWPILDFSEVLSSSKLSVERLEFIIIIMWLIASFVTVMNFYYAIFNVILKIFKAVNLKLNVLKEKIFSFFLLFVFSFFAFFLKINTPILFLVNLGILNIFVVFLIPFFTYFILKFKGKLGS